MNERQAIATRRCADFLKNTRINAGVSQLQLAMRLKRSKGYVHRIEQGRRRINVVEFMDFVEALGKNASEAMKEVMRDFPSLFDWCREDGSGCK